MAGEQDATRVAIRRGQRLFRAGKQLQAADVWRAALAEAYAGEDYAGMFVLTKNLGEASLALAQPAIEADAATTTARLQDAIRYFKYALGLIDQCELRDMIQAYGALQASVARVESQLAKAELQLRAVEARGEEEAPTVDIAEAPRSDGASGSRQACTTCERIPVASELVLDESDGCYYCIECYEEYYASLRPVEEPSAEEADEQVAEDEESDSVDDVNERSDDITGVDADGLDLLAAETVKPPSPAEISSKGHVELSLADNFSSADLDTSGNHSQGVRIELGSLADVLGQSLALGEQALIDTVSVVAITDGHDDQADGAEPTEQDQVASEAEQLRPAPARYSIQELLELGRLVPEDACPFGLELLPVHKSNLRSPQPAKAPGRNSKR